MFNISLAGLSDFNLNQIMNKLTVCFYPCLIMILMMLTYYRTVGDSELFDFTLRVQRTQSSSTDTSKYSKTLTQQVHQPKPLKSRGLWSGKAHEITCLVIRHYINVGESLVNYV